MERAGTRERILEISVIEKKYVETVNEYLKDCYDSILPKAEVEK